MSEFEKAVTGLGEECGVFGAYDMDGHDVAASIYYGLFALQHRGQESQVSFSCLSCLSGLENKKGQASACPPLSNLVSVVSVAARTISTRAVAALTARLLLRQDVLRHGTRQGRSARRGGRGSSLPWSSISRTLTITLIADSDDIRRHGHRALDVELS